VIRTGLAVLVVTASLAAGAARALEVTDAVVAVVGDQPLMLSDVQFETEVGMVRDAGGAGVNLGPPKLDVSVLESLIDRAVVLQEVGGEDLGVDEEVQRSLEEFLDRFDRIEDLTRWLGRWKIGTAELRTHFADEIRARTYIELRMAAATRVSDREVIEAYRTDQEHYQELSPAEAQAAIREALWQQRHDEQYARWLSGLRKKRGVRYTDIGRERFELEEP
jgi:hypothetical protein